MLLNGIQVETEEKKQFQKVAGINTEIFLFPCAQHSGKINFLPLHY